MKLLGFPDRAILLIRKLHYTIIRGYNRQNPRCDNNLGKLERYRLVTIRGGNGTGAQTPISNGLYSEFLDGTVLQVSFCLSAEGVLLSGHIEFPGHITLQVSFCVTLSFLVTCLGHCEYSPVSWRCPLVWTPKFPGHLSIITWMDT